MKKFVPFFSLIALSLTAIAQPQIVAHRGYHQKDGAARNSIEALEMAQKEGFEWIEIDVNLSSDGVPMAIHSVDSKQRRGYSPNGKIGHRPDYFGQPDVGTKSD